MDLPLDMYFLIFQILCLFDSVEVVNVDKIVEYIASLQQPDGSFYGDKWGEVDTRFSFCAVACLSLLVSYIQNKIDVVEHSAG